MADRARKATINYGGIELEVYQLPSGEYKLSQTQVAQAVGNGEDNVRYWLTTKAPENLDADTISSIGKKLLVEGGSKWVKSVNFKVALVYWTHCSVKGNALASALVSVGSEEKLTRLADEVFGVKKSEGDYHQESVVNLQQNQQIFSMMNTLLTRIEQMDANIQAIAPVVEAGKVAKKVYTIFPNYEQLFNEVSLCIDCLSTQEMKPLSNWLYELGFRDISHGERITIGRRVCNLSSTGDHDWFKYSPKKGRKKYHKALLPLIKDATLFVLSTRNNVRLIK